MDIKVIKSRINHLADVSELFAQYRVFYKQPYDLQGAEAFIRERLEQNDSVIFIAYADQRAAGFVQLYPSFTSVGMKKLWILNDLYVHQDFRKAGVATTLFESVFDYAKETDRAKVILSTDDDNLQAQQLYEKLSFHKEATYNYEKAV